MFGYVLNALASTCLQNKSITITSNYTSNSTEEQATFWWKSRADLRPKNTHKIAPGQRGVRGLPVSLPVYYNLDLTRLTDSS